MSELSAAIQAHFGQAVADDVFDTLLARIAAEPDADERAAQVEHVLRVVRVTPAQVVTLAKTPLVRDHLGLQLVLKRFVREREYEAERQQYAARSEWRKVAELILAFTPF